MNQSSAGKWARRAVWGMLVAVAGLGCNPLNIAGFLFARPDITPAPYPLTFAKDGPKKDKEEVVVLVLAQASHGGNPQFATVDRDLASKIAKQLPELAKENKDKKLKVRVISPTQVDKFKMANPKWKTMPPGEIGQKLEADYVLEIYLEKLRLYEPNTVDKAIYKGGAEVSVSIYEVGATGGDFKDKYDFSFVYPKGGVRSADSIPESEFKKLFLENLTTEIIRNHVDSRPSSGIAE